MQQVSQLKQQGRQAFDRKDYGTALSLFREILEEHPQFADIRHHAALCLIFLGRGAEALDELDAALAANPRYVEAHLNRALLLQDLGRYDEARESFERAGELEQQSEGRYPAAITARLATAHAAVGDVYLDAGAYAEAAAQYQAAIELRPRFHDIRNRFAEALLAQGRSAEAQAELRQILEWNPRFLAARLNLGLALLRQGDRSGAATEWELCRLADADNPQLRAYLAILDQPDEQPESDG